LIFAVNPHTGAPREVASMSPGVDELADVAFDRTGNFLAIPECGIPLIGFDRRTGALQTRPRSPAADLCLNNVLFNPVGNFLAGALGSPAQVRLYTLNTHTGRLMQTAALRKRIPSETGEMSFSPNGRLLLVPAFDGCGVAVLSVARGHQLENVPGSPFLVRSCADNAVAVRPGGGMIATLVNRGVFQKIMLLPFDERRGAIQQTPLAPPVSTGGQYPRALAFSPNGKFLVAGNGIAYGQESVNVFLVPTCADPDDDSDCDR
jgi:hypothetical protein